MSELLPCVEVEIGEKPQHCVIWLHGLGSDGHDFEGLVPSLNLEKSLSVRFIFPHAPRRPVTVNGGMAMRAWYDIYEMTLDRKVDMENIQESCEQIEALVAAQIDLGIPAENIVIAGFSQGGVIANQLALHSNHKFAGVMALSTYLADSDQVPLAQECVNGKTPLLIHHGSQDPIVDPSLAIKAKDLFTQKGFDLVYKTYPMPHSVCPEQVIDISAWLNERLS